MSYACIADLRCVKNFSDCKNCVASFGTTTRKINIVRINLKSTFSYIMQLMSESFHKDITKGSNINPWQANIVSFNNFLCIPLFSYAISLLLDIVTDYSNLVKCVKKRAAKINWPDFVKENLVCIYIGKSGRREIY